MADPVSNDPPGLRALPSDLHLLRQERDRVQLGFSHGIGYLKSTNRVGR